MRPVITARIFVHHYSTQYYNIETVFINIPLPPDQHHISDVAKWTGAKGQHCGHQLRVVDDKHDRTRNDVYQ